MTKQKATPEYTGPLGIGYMPLWADKAYKSLCAQRSRCNRRKDKSYKWYGEKGIKVKYSSREFLGWWEIEKERFPPGTKLVCSRVDHTGDYEFGNVKLEPNGANISECNSRTHSRAVVCYIKLSRIKVAEFKSLEEASGKTGCSMSYVWDCCNKKRVGTRVRNPLWFEYVDQA